MKKSHRIIALLMALMMASLTACGTAPETPAETTAAAETTVPEETTVAEETTYSRENTPDNLPADLNFEGKTVHFGTLNSNTASLLWAEASGDVVQDAAYYRNLSVEERLKVKLKTTKSTETNGNAYMSNIRSLVNAGDAAYEAVTCGHCYMAPLVVEGYFTNVATAPYLDYDQPWWAEKFMQIISLNENNRYILVGDILDSTVAGMSSVFFNHKLFADYYGAPDTLYDLVLDGKWTIDKMREYASGAYKDVDGNGKLDMNDILGLGTTASSPTEHFAYPMGMKFIERDSEGYPSLIKDNTRNVEITEKLYKLLYETEGVYVNDDNNSINNELPAKFAAGTMLFHANTLSAAGAFREAKDPYGVVPRPKLNEEQEAYGSLVHDSSYAFAIPITTKDLTALCATMEALAAEGYRTVIPAYYEITLKVKYAHDSRSSQMMDIIHQNATTDWIYANNYALSSGGSLGTIQRTLMRDMSSDFMSTYTSLASQVETSLKDMITKAKAGK